MKNVDQAVPLKLMSGEYKSINNAIKKYMIK